jgi:AraC family transcriptional regulator
LNRREPKLARALAPLSGGGSKCAALPPWQEKKLTRFIDAHIHSRIGVEELAAVVGLSRCYFSRAFRLSFRVSPAVFVIQLRIERVRILLVQTELPLAQIAADCGFRDQARLSHAFKRIAGVPPSVWRQSR